MASRLAWVAVILGGLMAGCDRHETAETYDPRVDGIAPQAEVMATPHILDLSTRPSGGGTAISISTPGAGGGGATGGPEAPTSPPLPPTSAPAIPPPPDAE